MTTNSSFLPGQARSASARRGRLRIYFGAASGVGKTYAMLQAGGKLRAEGRDVLIGAAESHGCKEIAKMCASCDCLPQHTAGAREAAPGEFDLDAALARRPELILVDDLARINAPG